MKGDSTGRGLHVGGAEVGEFVGEDRFESAAAARRAIEDDVVPDLLRYATASGQRVIEAWRSRVRLGLGAPGSTATPGAGPPA